MTFEKQVNEAKKKKLENRIIRDITFIILGTVFLAISFLSAYNKNKKEQKKVQDKKVSIIEKNSFTYDCI